VAVAVTALTGCGGATRNDSIALTVRYSTVVIREVWPDAVASAAEASRCIVWSTTPPGFRGPGNSYEVHLQIRANMRAEAESSIRRIVGAGGVTINKFGTDHFTARPADAGGDAWPSCALKD
jgi:hypothetical protein